MKRKGSETLEKGEAQERLHNNRNAAIIERTEAILQRLHEMKSNISKLRLQCEELGKLRSLGHKLEVLCNACGNSIGLGQEIMTRHSHGAEEAHYHQECYEHLQRARRQRRTYRKKAVIKKTRIHRKLTRTRRRQIVRKTKKRNN